MSTVINNRKKAANQVQKISLTYQSPTDGSAERKKLIVSLSNKEKQFLNEYKTNQNNTEADVFTVFECKPSEYGGRTAVETDIPPLLVVEDIVSVQNQKSTHFYLPTHTIHRPEWVKTMPAFDNWLLSACRYPTLAEDKKTILPGRENNTKFVSQLDRVDIYLSCFHGTLLHWFYHQSETKYIGLLWKLQRTIQYILKGYGSTSPLNQKSIDELKKLIEKRDESLEDANHYKNFINNLHPAQYYNAMYYLLHHHPEATHKSRLVNPELLIWGLLTQRYIERNPMKKSKEESKEELDRIVSESKDYFNSDTIRSNLLRVFLERGFKTSGTIPHTLFVTTKDQLVELCHQKIGQKMFHLLKQLNFSVAVCQGLYDASGLVTINSFSKELITLSEQINQIKSLTSFCKMCCPTLNFSDELLAELLLQSQSQSSSPSSSQSPSQSDQYKVMNVSFSDQELPTPLLNKKFNTILQKLEETKQTIQDQKKSFQQCQDLLQHTLNSYEKIKTNHIFSKEYLEPSLSLVFSLCSMDSLDGLSILEYLFQHPELVGMGTKRLKAFCFRSTPENSELESYWKKTYKYYHNIVSFKPKANKCANRLLWECLQRNNGEGHALNKKENSEEGLLYFIPFQLIRQKDEKMIDIIKHLKFETDCPVCLENTKLVALHKDYRHAVCQSCKMKINTCPFCRVVL